MAKADAVADLYGVSASYEDLLQTRVATQVRISHLHNNRLCLDCNNEFAPKSLEKCPSCGGEKSTKRGEYRTCQGECKDAGITTRWKPTANECPHCRANNSIPKPKNTARLEAVLLAMDEAEKRVRKELEFMVKPLPVWDWAVGVKGLGLVTIGRIIGRTDFSRVKDVSAFWSHCGYGLKEGQRQCKRKGQLIDYDQRLRSSCYLMGQSLMRAKGSYYRLYLHFKREAQENHSDWTKAHIHNHAVRLMVKVALAHIFEVVKRGEGYVGDLRPYAFTILKHNDAHYIAPWEMVTPAPQGNAQTA